MSEGDFVIIRPHKPVKNGPKDIDESTDTYDTIDWLVKNVPGNTGKVGMWGISQPGFYATAGMIDAHPALVAVSPQAPVTDYYMGDDVYHNGAFMLAHRFSFYMGFRTARRRSRAAQPRTLPFDFGTPDGYDFFLSMGSLANADEKYFKHKQPMWNMNIDHTTYDEVWQSRAIWKYLKGIKPAVMLVGGWYDTEDPQGLLRQFDFMEKNTPPADMLVMGPWNHGGFSRGDGDRLGNVNFGSKTAAYYRETHRISVLPVLPEGQGRREISQGLGVSDRHESVAQVRRLAAARSRSRPTCSWTPRASWPGSRPAEARFDEYLSDPNKPVPYVGRIVHGILNTLYDGGPALRRHAARRAGVQDRTARSRCDGVRARSQVDLKVRPPGRIPISS